VANRATDRELAERVGAALQMLNDGKGSAYAAALLSVEYDCSLRTARRYVNLASLDLCNDLSSQTEIDTLASLSLHRLELIAGKAIESGENALAISATRAHLSALAAMRKAITAPVARFRLSTAYTAPPDTPF